MKTNTTVWDAFQAICEDSPDASALHGLKRSWTYSELFDAARRIGGGLSRKGLRSGDIVVVLAVNHPETVVTWLAGALTGIVIAPANYGYTVDELAYVVKHIGAKAILCDTDRMPVASRVADVESLPCIVFGAGDDDQRGLFPWSSLLESPAYSGPHASLDDLVEVGFTSGTTSKPKAVAFDHKRLSYLLAAWCEFMPLTSEDVAYGIVPLFHASGLRYSVIAPLMVGASSVVRPFSASSFWPEVNAYGCTYFFAPEGVPLILERLDPTAEERGHRLKWMIGGGLPEFVSRMEHRFGARFINAYGMTECGPVCVSPFDEDYALAVTRRAKHPDSMYSGVPIGREVEIRIVRDGVECPANDRGEIWVRSPGVFKEYLNDAEVTAQTIVDGRWLRTGDLGFKDETGRLYFSGRIKHVIRRSGENISAAEIEDVLLSHPDILEVAAVPKADDFRVEEIRVVVIEREPGCVSGPSVWEWCAGKLADYKIPRYVEVGESIPRNRVGKVTKHVLQGSELGTYGRVWDRERE